MLAIRVAAARRLPTVLTAASHMSTNTRPEGSVATSKGFGKREKAQEDEYARKHETELLKKLRQDIQAKKDELAMLEKKAEENKAK